MKFFTDYHRGFLSLGIDTYYDYHPLFGRLWFIALHVGPFTIGIENENAE